jgi:hypothetical protein
MIGVIASPSEHAVVSEFFELFKTPWEYYRSNRRYEVLILSDESQFPRDVAKLVVMYTTQQRPCDAEEKTNLTSWPTENRILCYRGARFPIYGDTVTFRETETGDLVDEESHQAAIQVESSRTGVVARIGYNLFSEIRTLLTMGQPVSAASIPALELHIALLRDLIIANGVPLIEIPPVPDGYQFIACLTHDIDHPSICRHRFDHTMLGFLYRAGIASFLDVIRGRAPFRKLLANWVAALKLPLVYLGLAKDFWEGFDRYTELEGQARSTFFVIPFKGCPGRTGEGLAPSHRASAYGASDVAVTLRKLMSADCEVALHGIDAWHDHALGRQEVEEVRKLTSRQRIGVRMHWLYFDEQSPEILESAGADYDSTIGYNETVGYRAGTTQVYKPLKATRLLELPLHIMDTALFFPCYLDLSPVGAAERVGKIIDNAVQFGGCVTVNWHDRSIAPERLWGDFYVGMLQELKNKGAWFSTSAEAVSWFRKRRSAVFQAPIGESGIPRVKIDDDGCADLPGLRLRVYNSKYQDVDATSSALASNL